MTSLKDLPQDNLIVLLAPRFNLHQGGHFYWYTKEIVAELNLHHPNYLVLSPPVDTNGLPDFIDSRWIFIEDFSKWGSDMGTKSPRILVKKMISILDNVKETESITLFSFESSFSMLVALLEIQRRIPKLKISVNLLDHGFWLKFFSIKLPFIQILILNFIRNLKNAESDFKLLHPSLSQIDSFGASVGLKVQPFRHISAFWKYSTRPLEVVPNQIRLLILPWSVDLDHVLEFVDSSYTKIGPNFSLHCHFKTQTDLNYFRGQIRNNVFDKIKFSVGVLSLEEYISQFKRSDLVWIPYTDFYHQTTGSGRAFDCLALGCPLIIDERSDLALMVGDFPLIYLCPDADITWINKFVDLISEEKREFKSYVQNRSKLQDLGADYFSPLNGIDSFLEPFESKFDKNKVAFRFTDYLSLEILYFIGFYFSKLKVSTKRIRKTLKFITEQFRKQEIFKKSRYEW